MKGFKQINISCQSNASQFKIIFAKKIDLNDKQRTTPKSKMLKPFHCTVCDFSTKWNFALSKHLKEFHDIEKQITCEICLRKDTLKKNQRGIHEIEKPF